MRESIISLTLIKRLEILLSRRFLPVYYICNSRLRRIEMTFNKVFTHPNRLSAILF